VPFAVTPCDQLGFEPFHIEPELAFRELRESFGLSDWARIKRGGTLN
jgi:hypothetical protein